MSVQSLARDVRDFLESRVGGKDLDTPWWTPVGSAWLMSHPATAFWPQHDSAPAALVPLTLEMVIREGLRTGPSTGSRRGW